MRRGEGKSGNKGAKGFAASAVEEKSEWRDLAGCIVTQVALELVSHKSRAMTNALDLRVHCE